MVNRFRMSLVAVLVAIAVIASACSDDSSTAAEGATGTEAAYIDSVEAISTEMGTTIEDAFDSAFENSEGRSFEQLLPGYSVALGTAISAELDALAQIEALDPPAAFETDHERIIEASRGRIEALTRQQAAADTGDTELIAQIDLELGSIMRDVLADLSPELTSYVVTTDRGDAAAVLFGDLDAEETEYLDAVATGWDEFNRRNRAFTETLQQSYSSNELLLLALLDAGAGEAFAAVRTVIVGIDPPPSYVEGHARLLAYLDEAVALDTTIAEAAETGNVVAFEVANYDLSLAGGRYSLEAPASLVAVNSDPANLVPPDDLPAAAYGEALWQSLQRFRILALERQVGSGVFPIVSDDKLAEAMALVLPTNIELTEESVAVIEALAPPAEFQAGHDRILAYLRGLIELRQSILQAATAGDLETLQTYGVLGGFAADRAETELWCAALADLGDDPIEPITATFFRPFAGGSLDRLCPAG